jgi:magnesium chelatase family protein
MNPCRCGHADDPGRACSRAPRCAADYQSRISGPLFDRIDLHVEVAALSPHELTLPQRGERSAEVGARVARARAVQAERYAGAGPTVRTNAGANGELLDKVAKPDAAGRQLLGEAVTRLGLTARGYHRILKVARTLADLDGADAVRRLHIAEALAYRRVTPGRQTAQAAAAG